jgi:hypothetical protein
MFEILLLPELEPRHLYLSARHIVTLQPELSQPLAEQKQELITL